MLQEVTMILGVRYWTMLAFEYFQLNMSATVLAKLFASNPLLANVVAFLGVEFAYYWFHRLGHEIGFLWAAHQQHHSSEDYNLSTAL
jgi:sterol desaturase/sphingolipid hydroxylase (fatty acid hydroxylase superfamily)